MSEGNRTPKERRNARKSFWSKQLLRAIALSDSSQSEAARQVAVSPSKVRHWCDPEHTTSFPLGDLEALPPATGEMLLRKVASRMGFALVPLDEDDELASFPELLANILREGGEASTTLATALADGHLTLDELHASLKEVREARSEYSRLESRLLNKIGEAEAARGGGC